MPGLEQHRSTFLSKYSKASGYWDIHISNNYKLSNFVHKALYRALDTHGKWETQRVPASKTYNPVRQKHVHKQWRMI